MSWGKRTWLREHGQDLEKSIQSEKYKPNGACESWGFRQQPPGLYKPTSSGELIGAYYDGETVKAFYTQQGKGDLESVWYFCLAPDGGLGYIRANNLQEVIPVV